MPAVIDTGGPRVLHCVERVERPIPRAQTNLSFLRSAHRNSEVRKQQPRLLVDESIRRPESVAESPGSRIDPAEKNIPGNNELGEFFIDERLSAAVPARFPSALGSLGVPRERSSRLRHRKYYDAFQRRQINRRKRLCHENNPRELGASRSASSSGKRESPRANENALRNEPPSATSLINENLRQRPPPTIFLATDNHQLSTTSPRHLTPPSSAECNKPEGIEQSADIVMRLLGGCDLEPGRQTSYRDMKKSVANSSQGVLNSSKYEWQNKCKCLSSITNRFVSITSESESKRFTTRERRKRHKPRIHQRKEASYLQLAFILFLVAFGNGNLFKSPGSGYFGGRSASVGAGLGVLTIGTILGTVKALPVDLDAGVRAERSANLSHISGASRKIQMYIKNRHLQILRDGTVNGSTDDTSEYTIFQRTSVSRGQLRIQGVATCLYLCMDSCGLLYGSREYTEECVFNETLEQHNYNTYSSVRWSTPKKSLYLGLNRRGQPRRVQAKGHNLGRLSAYARVLTQVAPAERVEALQARMLGAEHSVRHHHNSHHHRNKQHQQQAICPTLPPQERDGRDKFRCRKRKKRKKWKRRCNEGEKPGPHCGVVESHGRATNGTALKSQSPGDSNPPQSKRSCEAEASEELCRKQALDAPAKKRKSRIEPAKGVAGGGNSGQLFKRKKEARMKKPEGEPIPDGGANEDVNAGDTAKQKVVEPPGNKRRRQGIVAKQKGSSAPGTRKKLSGRPTRTTIANSTFLPVTSPSSWYPGVSAAPSTGTLPRQESTRAPSHSVRNSVTSSPSKDDWSEEEEDRQSLRTGKITTTEEEPPILPESSDRQEPMSEGSMEERSETSSTANDWSSIETSEEVKSEESSMQENETTIAFGEKSTLMTTMDTTPPQRTEDYTRPTTQSIITAVSADRSDRTSPIDDSRWLETSTGSNPETRSSLEKFAM
ncbi:uncharacterized protein bnl [Venturia canescens]|uniref:uncharacterized protein bnl n=1 Tax=Venturia canescens TaxID=32260 RepID=UPI001C9D578A|nr:uncharacterized protein LOC122415089 [Venturia canescens]XP_043282864.1 uncharacterized protein LOC122415089 [Venturia canescens]